MCIDLTEVDGNKCQAIAGGLAREIYRAYLKDIESIPAPTTPVAPINGAITMKPGKFFRKVAFPKDSGQMKFDPQGEAGNTMYKSSVMVDLKGMDPAIIQQLVAETNGEFVLLVRDAEGVVWLLGDTLCPVLMTLKGDSGKKASDKSFTSLEYTFEWKFAFRAYTGTIPLEDPVTP